MSYSRTTLYRLRCPPRTRRTRRLRSRYRCTTSGNRVLRRDRRVCSLNNYNEAKPIMSRLWAVHPLYNYSEEPVVQLRLSLNHAGSQIHEKQRDKAKGKASWRAAGGRAVYTSSYHEKATAHYDSLHRRDFHFLRAHWKASARNQSAGTRCGRKHEGVACCAKSEHPQRRCAHSRSCDSCDSCDEIMMKRSFYIEILCTIHRATTPTHHRTLLVASRGGRIGNRDYMFTIVN